MTRKSMLFALGLLVATSLFSAVLSGCGTTTGTYLVNVRFNGYTVVRLWDLLVPSAHASIDQLQFCFKRLRFKVNAGDSDSTNFDFEIGLKDILPSGTSLGEVSISAGVYRRIEFDLDDVCGAGYSVRVDNSSTAGPIDSTEHITIKFEGTFVHSADITLSLAVQAIAQAVNATTVAANIKTDLESATGSY